MTKIIEWNDIPVNPQLSTAELHALKFQLRTACHRASDLTYHVGAYGVETDDTLNGLIDACVARVAECANGHARFGDTAASQEEMDEPSELFFDDSYDPSEVNEPWDYSFPSDI